MHNGDTLRYILSPKLAQPYFRLKVWKHIYLVLRPLANRLIDLETRDE
jgi:hypothetical protein